ncbi:hypothetical protein D3871_17640 [Noviherbaspirillum saxi]|uniref:HEPN domain-containing protein n=2 Tax=Noviherbaspirillum saxi TaxID=2320863 RepID=A0A3A3FID8_9BURK|nr:hypothetical protein D3871_17640 [Noviherbaspirillum saxi]
MGEQPEPIDPWVPGSTSAGQMLWLANAYAEGAEVLADALVTDDFTRQFTSTRVVLHLCRHAAELYLKGAIGVATNQPPLATHRLDQLYAQYVLLYPQEHHWLEVPFSRQVLSADEGLFPGTMEEYQRTHDQRFRYLTDTKGKPFMEFEKFDVRAYAEAITSFRQALSILVARIEFPCGFD